MANVPSYERPQYYNNPPEYTGSYPQLIPFYWKRKALIDIKREMFFGQLADTMTMPKHMGKTIKLYHYIPLLDDRNVNDQGIDATGKTDTLQVTIFIYDPSMVDEDTDEPKGNAKGRQAVGEGSSATLALADAKAVAEDMFRNLGIIASDDTYATTKSALELAGWYFDDFTTVSGVEVPNHCEPISGNLYGSSRDVGTISGKLPVISETGGRVNRVGFTRQIIEGTIQEFGYFEEYTQESLDFENDTELMSHISREAMRAANYIYEDKLQIDMMNAANVVIYGGNAISRGTITGNTGSTASTLSYDMLIQADIMLNNNRCPKDTKIITGSRLQDTRTIGSTRYAYIAPELKTTLMKMVDYHNNPAFIPVQQYADAGNVATGEIGSCGPFRFIEDQWMLRFEGEGAAVTNNAGYMTHSDALGVEHYDVYPILIVGSGSFTTVGFHSGSNDGGKFKILHKAPGLTMANRDDPYGKIGFWSIQWWYGTLVLRPEWICLMEVVCPR